MKKLILALCLVAAQANSMRAVEPVYEPDPYTIVESLQRVISTSTNPRDIIEAERLIREVYGPKCNELFWYRTKLALKAAGVVAIGAAVAVMAYTLTK